jgi:hypothetical protein
MASHSRCCWRRSSQNIFLRIVRAIRWHAVVVEIFFPSCPRSLVTSLLGDWWIDSFSSPFLFAFTWSNSNAWSASMDSKSMRLIGTLVRTWYSLKLKCLEMHGRHKVDVSPKLGGRNSFFLHNWSQFWIYRILVGAAISCDSATCGLRYEEVSVGQPRDE